MSAPCPCCDLGSLDDSPLVAFAYGVTLGVAFLDMHRITELMCAKHRTAYVLAMARTSVDVNVLADP